MHPILAIKSRLSGLCDTPVNGVGLSGGGRPCRPSMPFFAGCGTPDYCVVGMDQPCGEHRGEYYDTPPCVPCSVFRTTKPQVDGGKKNRLGRWFVGRFARGEPAD